MRVIDVCSGIGTTAVAWHSLGWEHLCFAEIEKFPSAVLKHRWPGIVNEGDFTQIGDKYRGSADLMVGGTPCQSFSVAGLRGGLADDRGNLALEFLRLADRTRPRWVVWENVPGVLSSNGGRDFGSILGGLAQLGYGWAYRILDAQYAGVPQRRRRVFVVGCLGDWRAAVAVLFERHSLQGNHPPRREKGQGFTYDVAPCIAASGRGFERSGDTRGQDCLVSGAVFSKWAKGTGGPSGDECYNLVTHPLRADGFDASEDGTGRGTPIVPCEVVPPLMSGSSREAGHNARSGHCKDSHIVPVSIGFSAGQSSKAGSIAAREEQSPTLRGAASGTNQVPAVALTQNQAGDVLAGDVMHSLGTNQNATGRNAANISTGMAVRRLTPRECERLQGLPDYYTLVPFNGKPAADGPRYKAIGNGMAVPVVKWIGERIQQVEASLKK